MYNIYYMATPLIKRSVVLDSSINIINNNISIDYYNKSYIDTNFTRKTQFDTSYSSVYKKIELDQILQNYHSKSNIDSSYNQLIIRTNYSNLDSYYNKNYIDSSFSQVYNKAQIDSSLANYYSKSYIDSSFSNIGSIVSSLFNPTNYHIKSYIDSSFSSIYNRNQIDSSFANYYRKTNIDSSFSSIYTKNQVDNSFNNYYNKTNIDSSFNSIYTKSEANSLYTLSNLLNNSQFDENIDISLNSLYIKIDSSFNYIKTYANSNFYNKNTVDTSFISTEKLDMSLNSIYLSNIIDTSFSNIYTKTYLDSSLNTNYVSRTYMDSSINNYATKVSVDTSLNNYYKSDILDSSFNTYSKKIDIDSSFSSIYTKSILDSSLNNYYVSKTYLDSSLNNYTTKSRLDSSLNTVYTQSIVDISLNRYTQKTYIDSSLNTNYTLKSYVDTSLNNFYAYKRDKLYYVSKRDASYQNVNTVSADVTLTTLDISSNGYPILIIAYGDAVLNTTAGWQRLAIFRGSTQVGSIIQIESDTFGESCPFSTHVIDTPPTVGNITYTLKSLYTGSSLPFHYGSVTGPSLSAIELTGPKSIGVNTTNIQTGIVIGATTTAPNMGTRTTDKIEYQRLGNKIKLTYRLSFAGGASGSGDYLINLPLGMRFNTTNNPFNTGVAWNVSQKDYAQYQIPASGGNVYSGSWNIAGGSYIIPYDNNGAGSTGRFRYLTTWNLGNSTFTFWGSTFYSAAVSDQLWIISFEIWV